MLHTTMALIEEKGVTTLRGDYFVVRKEVRRGNRNEGEDDS